MFLLIRLNILTQEVTLVTLVTLYTDNKLFLERSFLNLCLWTSYTEGEHSLPAHGDIICLINCLATSNKICDLTSAR